MLSLKSLISSSQLQQQTQIKNMKKEYNDTGNVISQTYPDGRKFTYEYDDKGKLISQVLPNGDKYIYEYDDLGRMLSITYPDGSKTTF